MNIEMKRKKMLKWYYKNRERQIQKNREWKKENREHMLKQKKEYHFKNRDGILERKKEYRKNNDKNIKQYRKNNKERDHTKQKEYRINNIEKEKIRHAKYSKANPDKMLKNHINSVKKLGISLNMTRFEMGMALKTWSLAVRKIFVSCKICGEKTDVAHHILNKQYYPKLALNINNGISLCKLHHKEVHGQLLIRGRD